MHCRLTNVIVWLGRLLRWLSFHGFPLDWSDADLRPRELNEWGS